MRFALVPSLGLLVGALPGLACVGRTAGEAIDFPVAAAGPDHAVTGQPLSCADERWDVALTEATLHIGAIYLDQSKPTSGAGATSCTLDGTYVAQQVSALDVDLLSPEPQPFPVAAHGITLPSPQIGEVWLTRGYIDRVLPMTSPQALPVLVVAGTATPDGGATSFPFTGSVTIESAYSSSGAVAAGDSICRKRILSLIPAPVTLASTGGLLLRIDPCRFFAGVDFGQLPADAAPGTYRFPDDPAAPDYVPSGSNLYGNLHSTGPYTFSWDPDL